MFATTAEIKPKRETGLYLGIQNWKMGSLYLSNIAAMAH